MFIKITSEIYMSFLLLNNNLNHWILMKIILEIPLFPIKKLVDTQMFSSITDMLYVFPAWSSDDTFKKESHPMVTLTACFLASLFNLLFSKLLLKILATF